MAPEQVLDEAIDGRADLYAFAVVLCQMFAGRRPYRSTTTAGLIREIVDGPPPDVAALLPPQARRSRRPCCTRSQAYPRTARRRPACMRDELVAAAKEPPLASPTVALPPQPDARLCRQLVQVAGAGMPPLRQRRSATDRLSSRASPATATDRTLSVPQPKSRLLRWRWSCRRCCCRGPGRRLVRVGRPSGDAASDMAPTSRRRGGPGAANATVVRPQARVTARATTSYSRHQRRHHRRRRAAAVTGASRAQTAKERHGPHHSMCRGQTRHRRASGRPERRANPGVGPRRRGHRSAARRRVAPAAVPATIEFKDMILMDRVDDEDEEIDVSVRLDDRRVIVFDEDGIAKRSIAYDAIARATYNSRRPGRFSLRRSSSHWLTLEVDTTPIVLRLNGRTFEQVLTTLQGHGVHVVRQP